MNANRLHPTNMYVTQIWSLLVVQLIRLTHRNSTFFNYSRTVKLMHNNVFLNKYYLGEEVAMATGRAIDSAVVIWVCLLVLSLTPT